MMRFGVSLRLCANHLSPRFCLTSPYRYVPSFTTSIPKSFENSPRQGITDFVDDGDGLDTTDRSITFPPSQEAVPTSGGQMRLNKWLAHQGICSRREADDWISRGLVRVNGQVVTTAPAFCVPGKDHVQVHKDKTMASARGNATILMHKPLGVVSSQPEKGHSPAIKLLTADRHFRPHQNRRTGDRQTKNHDNPFRQRGWAVAGRLDINSTGLLVFTQSGVVAQQIVSPRPGVSSVEKEYLVRIPSSVTNLDERLEILRHGVQDNDDFLQAVSVESINEDQLRIVLTQGKHHHIRRMLKSVQLPVRALKRVRIGNVVLADLPLGQWRYMGPHETFR